MVTAVAALGFGDDELPLAPTRHPVDIEIDAYFTEAPLSWEMRTGKTVSLTFAVSNTVVVWQTARFLIPYAD